VNRASAVTTQQARALLGLGPAASRDDTDRAFRALAAAHHPDRGGDPATFRVLVAARETLRTSRHPAPVVFYRRSWWRDLLRLVTNHARPREPRVQ